MYIYILFFFLIASNMKTDKLTNGEKNNVQQMRVQPKHKSQFAIVCPIKRSISESASAVSRTYTYKNHVMHHIGMSCHLFI